MVGKMEHSWSHILEKRKRDDLVLFSPDHGEPIVGRFRFGTQQSVLLGEEAEAEKARFESLKQTWE